MPQSPMLLSTRLSGCTCCGPMRRGPELRRLAKRRERQATAREVAAELAR